MRISDWSSDVCSSDLQVENLACAGAFDSLCPNRAQVFHAAESIVRHASAAASERDSAQVSLFGGAGDSAPTPLPLPPVEAWPGMGRLHHEFAAVGFSLSARSDERRSGTKCVRRVKIRWAT